MAAEDAGSIYSEVRIRIDKLKQDIVQATTAIDRLGDEFTRNADQYANIAGKRYKAALESIAKEINNVNAAEKAGALSTREQIERLLKLRKEELQVLQNKAVKEGTASAQTVSAINNTKAAILQLEAAEKKLTPSSGKGINALSLGAVAASAAIIGAFRSLITTTAEYEQALSNVQAATRGTAQDLSNLEGAAASAGDELATSTTDALGAVEALAKAGVSTADIMGGALPGALTLAAAGSMNVADAAEIAAATMTQFGLSGSDVTHIADLLAAGAGKAQGEVSDLSQALKQAGLVASQTGLSVDDTVGSLAAFASAGLLGSDAGTSFRTMLLRLTPQSKEAADRMKDLGINAFDAKGEFIGITAFAGQLQDKLKGLTTEQRNSALATIFGSDSIRAANVLYSQGAKGIGDWISKVNDSGFAAEVARIKLDNLAGDQKRLDAAITDTTAKIGDGLNPILRGLTQFLTGVVDLVGKIPAPITSFAIGAGVLAASLVGLNAGLGLMGITVAALTGPLGLAVIGITALTVGIVAATSAIAEADLKEATKQFGAFGKASGLSGKELDSFVTKAREVSDELKNMTDFDKDFGAQEFKDAAKNAGLTNAQLAHIVTNLSNVPPNIKLVAKGFLDAKVEADLLFQQQKTMWSAMDEFYSKKYPKAAKKASDATTDGAKTTQEAQDRINQALKATQEAQRATMSSFLVGNEKTRLGLETELERLGEIQNARSAEIDSLLAYRAINGSLSKEQNARLLALLKGNQDDAEAQRQLTQEVQDRSSAETEAYQTWKSETDARKALQDDLLANATEDTLSMIDLESLTTDQLIALNEKLSLAKAATRAKEKSETVKLSEFILNNLSNLATSLSSIFAAMSQNEIDNLTYAYDKQKELIENNGVTKQQSLQDTLDTAKATLAAETDASKLASDQQAVDDAQKALDLYNLEAAYTKKKAELEYQSALASWEIQLAMATATAANAVIGAYNSQVIIPFIGPIEAPIAAGIAAAFGALQIGAVLAAMPKPPKFATGGIVLGNSFSGDNVPAMVNSGEMVLTKDQQAQLFAQANGNGSGNGGKDITVLVVLNGKTIAQAVAREFNNGTVKVEL